MNEPFPHKRSPQLSDEADARPPVISHGALFLRFLRFGASALGGPVAQIVMIRRELVDEEKWTSWPLISAGNLVATKRSDREMPLARIARPTLSSLF